MNLSRHLALLALLAVLAAPAALVAETLVLLAPLRPAPLPGTELVDAVPGDDSILVVYVAGTRLLAQRVSLDGLPIDPVPREISGYTTHGQFVLRHGSGWIVIWGAEGLTLRAEMTEEGEISEPAPLFGGTVLAAASVDGELAIGTPGATAHGALHVLGSDFSIDSTIDLPSWPGGVARTDSGWIAVIPQMARHGWSTYGEHGAGDGIDMAGTRAEFHAHPEGGGLLLVHTFDGLWVSLLGRDGRWSELRPFPSPMIAVLSAKARGSGWVLLLRAASDASGSVAGTIVEIDADSSMRDRAVGPIDPAWGPGSAALVPGTPELVFAGRSGVRTLVTEGDRFVPRSILGVEAARQENPVLASSPSVTLVVWNEPSLEGTALRATRVDPTGAPLDAEGIVLSQNVVAGSHRTTFDGERFVVVWIGPIGALSTWVARIQPEGALVAERESREWRMGPSAGMDSSVDGRALAVWYHPSFEPEPNLRGALIEDGVPRQEHTLAPRPRDPPTKIELAWNGQAYLAVWHTEFFCGITGCGPIRWPVSGMVLSTEGTPLTTEVRYVEDGREPDLIGIPGGWLLAWTDTEGRHGARIESTAALTARFPLPRGVFVRDGGPAIANERGTLRIGPRGEPLHWAGRAGTSATLVPSESGSWRLVRRVGDEKRIWVESDATAKPRADLALTVTDVVRGPDSYSVRARIEHRGGDPVPSAVLETGFGVIAVENVSAIESVTTPVFLVPGPLHPGQVIDLELEVLVGTASQSLWLLPEAIDSDASNNVASIGAPQRRRIAVR